MSRITRQGFLKLAFEIYFVAEIYKIATKSNKSDVEAFLGRLAKVMAKDQNKEVVETSKKQFLEPLSKIVRVFREKPEMMRQYLEEKKKN